MPASAVPVDVWVAVLDAVYDAYYHHPSDFVWQSDPDRRSGGPLHNFHDLSLRQRTLQACALTCRAWRERAQFLLWKHVVFTVEPSRQFSSFLVAMHSRIADYQLHPPVSSLYMLGQYMPSCGWEGRPIQPLPHWHSPLATSGDSFPDPGLPSALDRLRTPLFPALTEINLTRCTFHSVCDFFEFLWSCPQLSHLVLQDCDVQRRHVDPVAIQSMDTFARSHKTEILTKLTSLYIHGYPLSRGLRYTFGPLFGLSVATLHIGCGMLMDLETIAHFIQYWVPTLQELHITILITHWYASLDQNRQLSLDRPFIFALATNQSQAPRPLASLRTLTFRVGYSPYGDQEHQSCCALFGRHERPDLPVARSLFPELSWLAVDIGCCELGLGKHACFLHIASALPSMVDVLRFRHKDVTFEVVDGHLRAVSD